MHVRMTETAEGSPDGIEVNEYLEGRTYDLPGSLGENFLERGVAEEVEQKPSDPRKRETKPQTAPETKPSSPDEEKESPDSGEESSDEAQRSDEEEVSGEVEMERTSEGSPYYQFRKPNGELFMYTDEGEEKPVRSLGEDNAEKKRKELQESLETDESDEE